MEYKWLSENNGFVPYEAEYEEIEQDVEVVGEDGETHIEKQTTMVEKVYEGKLYSQEEVDALMAQCGASTNKVLRDVNGEPQLVDYFSQSELLGQQNATRIAYLKSLLRETDYIDNKLVEALINGDNELLEELKITYATQLVNRQAWRNEINELEG